MKCAVRLSEGSEGHRNRGRLHDAHGSGDHGDVKLAEQGEGRLQRTYDVRALQAFGVELRKRERQAYRNDQC